MIDVNNNAYAYGKPLTGGVFKAIPDDFRVDEILGFELSGTGEHQFLKIEKSGLNTEELIKRLAKAIEKPVKLISHAGLKDRQAITTQWLSVHCPGEEITGLDELSGQGWRVLEHHRHLKKLKIGGLHGNQFTLVLRDIDDYESLEKRLACIKASGVPNYFGLQRFGRDGQNVVKAEAVLLKGQKVKDRFLRGMYYSAARSYLFNRILSQRVEQQTWNKALSGDVMQLAGSHSLFKIDTPDELIVKRMIEQDISPASVLWGKGEDLVRLEAQTVQQLALTGFEPWCKALEHHDLSRAYRAHVLQLENFTWDWQEDNVTLSFALTAGAYATSVLRELIIDEE